MDDDDDDEDRLSVCPLVRQRGARVGLGRRVPSFVRSCVRASRNGTERAGRVVVGEDVVVVVSSSLLVFKSFLWRRTRDDDGARMVRRRR